MHTIKKPSLPPEAAPAFQSTLAKQLLCLALAIFTVIFLMVWFAPPTSANPVFAKRFKVPCSFCHVAFPKLNSFGNLFAGNGYKFPGMEVKTIFESFGDPNLLLENPLGLGVRVDSFLRYRNDTSVAVDFETPAVAKLFFQGYLTQDTVFYSYFLFNEGGEVVGLEDAFLYFNNIIGNENLDIIVGQFQVMDPVRAREQRLTFRDLPLYTTSFSRDAFKLTYQRGILISYGKGPVQVFGGVVNGNGIGAKDTNGNFDADTFKDPFGRIILAPVAWGSLGAYVYYGDHSPITLATGPTNTMARHNYFYRVGPDFQIQPTQQWSLRGQLLYGRDSNPTFTTGTPMPVHHYGSWVELDYHYSPTITAVVLHNLLRSKDDPTKDVNSLTGNVTYYWRTNVKSTVEFTYDIQQTSAFHTAKTHEGVIGLVFGF